MRSPKMPVARGRSKLFPRQVWQLSYLGEGSWARSTTNNDGDGAVRQHLKGFATEHNG